MSVDAGIKALLDGSGMGLTAVFLEGQDYDQAVMPYVSIIDPITEIPALSGDALVLAWRRELQLDLWQARDAYDPTLSTQVVDLLDGEPVDGGMGLRVVQSLRVPDDDTTVTHHAITVSVGRLR